MGTLRKSIHNVRRSAGHRYLSGLSLLLAFSLLCIDMAGSNAYSREPGPQTVSAGITLPDQARESVKIIGLRGLSNVGRVAPGILRGAQPGDEGYRTLKRMGIKTVINLRSRHSEKEAVTGAGMKSLEIPIGMLDGMDKETVKQVIRIMSDPDNQPLYLHCALGEDRTGIIVAVYRMEVDGWSLADAEAEMQAFGFNDIWINLKKFLRNYNGAEGTHE